MAKYRYIAKNSKGKTLRDTEDAGNREELVAKLRNRGLFIVSIKEESGVRSKVLSTLTARTKRSSIKIHDLAFLARNLATTLSSGVTLLRSLEIISIQTESAKLASVLTDCSRLVKEGLSLSEAVMRHPKVFSSLWQGIVEVGESSGNLPFVLEKLAGYLERRMEFERKVKGAMVYPSILMVAASIAMLVFFKFILPKFTEMFESFNIQLPPTTQFLFTVTNIVEKHFILIIIGFVGFFYGLYYFITSKKTRPLWHKIQLRIPLLGDMFFVGALERLTSTIFILLDSGLPLVSTLEVASRGVGNNEVELNLAVIKEHVRDGASLSREFSKLQMFPMLIAEMARIGEETGTMPQVFEKISIYYQKELSAKVDRFITAFEPIMIIVMGVVIGGIVISLFLPLFELSSGGM